jgi:hypothetical protein
MDDPTCADLKDDKDIQRAKTSSWRNPKKSLASTALATTTSGTSEAAS